MRVPGPGGDASSIFEPDCQRVGQRVRRSGRRHGDPRPTAAPQPRHHDPWRQLPDAREAPLGVDQNAGFAGAGAGMSEGANLDRGSPTGVHRYPPCGLRGRPAPSAAAWPSTLGGQFLLSPGGQFRMSFDSHLTSSRGRIESHKAIQCPFPLFRRFRPFGQATARRA